jgi:hypothetical protein
MDDTEKGGATSRDLARPGATTPDNDFTLPLEEVSERYARAGHPRTIRSLQRYCAVGHLDCQKVATTIGDKYLATAQSVARHIAQIEELRSYDTVATGRDVSRPGATAVAAQESAGKPPVEHTTGNDSERQVPTGESEASRYVALLERAVEQSKDEREFLHEQIDRKDKTIDSLIERDRETNVLVRGLQEMLTPLLSAPRHEPREHESPGA